MAKRQSVRASRYKENTKPIEGGVGFLAPNYYSDGSIVVSFLGDRREEDQFDHGPNSSPGWEVAGGYVMSFLVNSRNAERLFSPPSDFPITWDSVGDATWQGTNVKEIKGTIKKILPVSIFYSDNPLKIEGMQYIDGPRKGWRKYVNQKFNPKLPEKLGDPPKK